MTFQQANKQHSALKFHQGHETILFDPIQIQGTLFFPYFHHLKMQVKVNYKEEIRQINKSVRNKFSTLEAS